MLLARSDAGRLKIDREKVDFSDLCETVVWQQESIGRERSITVEGAVESGVYVWGDETMLIRILLNLVDNALKYGKPGGHAVLSLKADGSWACCTVKDDGIGIKEEDLPKIWQRFYRVEESRSEEGSGLGLAMVEAMVKAHGGTIEAFSIYGKGSEFSIKLPLYEKQQELWQGGDENV